VKDDIDKTLEDRGKRYNLNGTYADHANLTQYLKWSCRNHKGWDSMPGEIKESIDMILHKIARVINGDPRYKDNWVDIEGYAKLISRELKDE
jgi:hypothetical protein